MIVVDTNVLSETTRPKPDPHVLHWLRSVGDEAAITSVTVGELLYGVRRLPDGKRRRQLAGAVERLISGAAERLLAYDDRAAQQYADLRVSRERSGRPVTTEDLMIAAICLAHDLPLATRNVRDFDGFGLTVIDPWRGSS